MTFDEWYAIVKTRLDKLSLPLPEDIELMELAHMECRADEKSIDTFVKEYAASF